EESTKRSSRTQTPASSSGTTPSSTSCARAAAYSSASARAPTSSPGSLTNARTRSASSTPPGSRRTRTAPTRAASSRSSAVASVVAAELLADGAPDQDAVRGRVERGSHPDLTWVTPSGAHELLVGDIDAAVVGAAARTPFEARRRVFVIERADTMIEQAANK